MKRFAQSLVMTGTMILFMAGCHKTSESSGEFVHLEPKGPASAEKTQAAQNRMNGFFYAAVAPRLKACWPNPKDKGEIAFKFTYGKEGNNWVWQQQEVENSGLPKDQTAAALDCMQNAARGSSLPMEAEELTRKVDRLVIHWNWPVPLPSDTSELARMISTGGGGGEPKLCRCKDCTEDESHVSVCSSSCSGWVSCTPDGTGTGCKMTGGACVSGWSGIFSPIFIARNEP